MYNYNFSSRESSQISAGILVTQLNDILLFIQYLS